MEGLSYMMGRSKEVSCETIEIKEELMKILVTSRCILTFQDQNDPKAYLKWEKKIDLIYDCRNYSIKKKNEAYYDWIFKLCYNLVGSIGD